MIVLVIALALLVQALAFLGGRAAIPLGTALLTLVALFVLTRSRILKQRNGGFVGLAIVCLMASLVPLVEYGGNRLALSGWAMTANQSASDVTNRGATSRADLPLLTQVYKIPVPEQNTARFKVLQDLHVSINDKSYLLKAGEILPLVEKGNGEVRFAAGEQQIALRDSYVELIKPGAEAPVQPAGGPSQIADATNPAPSSATEPTLADTTAPSANPGEAPGSVPPQDETPAQVTQRAQKEAIRRYPALGQKDSPENHLFVETYQELKHSGAADFFQDPQWPLQLAELLAKREGWEKQQ